jgi:nucleolar protein 9
MPKPRTKRTAIREERKKRKAEVAKDGASRKRARVAEEDHENDNDFDDEGDGEGIGFEHYEQDGFQQQREEYQNDAGEKEFFGMLADDEQEYFRHADEMLEINQFPSPEDRQLFVESVFREAQGKELKLASSQSCSRLMERLIQISTTAQKKRLFEAFAGHFLSLVQHRFASHCCEALFLRSAGVVTQELAGFVMDTAGAASGEEAEKGEASMEGLFLATLDELEGNINYLITDRFASHTLRVLLLVLSGRPLEDASIKTLIKSKNKEKITVAGSAEADQANQGLRAVPGSFALAVRKIIQDSVSGLHATSLRVLARHPIGNPTLQLLLELDLTLTKQDSGKSKPDPEASSPDQPTLLFLLLPGAPKSLSDDSSEASEFINGMIYDQIGSRLVETLITHAPGKIFKALNQNIFLPRIEGYVRNDVSSYASIRVLNRLGKDDLITAVDKIVPTMPQLVAKERYNVIRTLFERCAARDIKDGIKKLNKGLKEGCGPEPADLITTLCGLKDEEKKKKDVAQLTKNAFAIQSHGAQLLTTLLSIPGPTKGVQERLLALSPELLVRLATTSMPTVTVLTTALATPSANPAFHKTIVGSLLPHVADLATSQFGHNLINAIVEVPSKGKERSVPFHMKEAIMAKLGEHERDLRESWMGRSVWRSWKGDMWKTRRSDWKYWMRQIDPLVEAPQVSSANREAIKTPRIPQKQEEEKLEEATDAAEEPTEKREQKKKDKEGKKEKKEKKKKRKEENDDED